MNALTQNLRFRKTPINAETLTAEVICPIRAGSKGDHNFLSYWDARDTREEAERAVAARPDSRHPVLGYAAVQVTVQTVEPLKSIAIELDDDVAEALDSARQEGETDSDVLRRIVFGASPLVAIAESEADVEQTEEAIN